jgi:hypothetical protein
VEYILQRAEEDMKRLGGSWRGRGEGLLNARGFEKAEVDGVRGEYAITYGRYGTDNKALDYAAARADAPGGREADAERFSALSTLTSCVFLVPGGRLTIPQGRLGSAFKQLDRCSASSRLHDVQFKAPARAYAV